MKVSQYSNTVKSSGLLTLLNLTLKEFIIGRVRLLIGYLETQRLERKISSYLEDFWKR